MFYLLKKHDSRKQTISRNSDQTMPNKKRGLHNNFYLIFFYTIKITNNNRNMLLFLRETATHQDITNFCACRNSQYTHFDNECTYTMNVLVRINGKTESMGRKNIYNDQHMTNNESNNCCLFFKCWYALQCLTILRKSERNDCNVP